MFLNIFLKIHQFLSSIKSDAHEEYRFLFLPHGVDGWGTGFGELA